MSLKWEGPIAPVPWIDRLVEQEIVTPDQVAEAAKTAADLDITPAEMLVRLAYVPGAVIAKAQAAAYGCELVSLAEREVPREVFELVPHSIAFENQIFAIAADENELVVAVAYPDNEILKKLGFILGRTIRCAFATTDEIEAAIKRHYGEPPEFVECYSSH